MTPEEQVQKQEVEKKIAMQIMDETIKNMEAAMQNQKSGFIQPLNREFNAMKSKFNSAGIKNPLPYLQSINNEGKSISSVVAAGIKNRSIEDIISYYDKEVGAFKSTIIQGNIIDVLMKNVDELRKKELAEEIIKQSVMFNKLAGYNNIVAEYGTSKQIEYTMQSNIDVQQYVSGVEHRNIYGDDFISSLAKNQLITEQERVSALNNLLEKETLEGNKEMVGALLRAGANQFAVYEGGDGKTNISQLANSGSAYDDIRNIFKQDSERKFKTALMNGDEETLAELNNNGFKPKFNGNVDGKNVFDMIGDAYDKNMGQDMGINKFQHIISYICNNDNSKNGGKVNINSANGAAMVEKLIAGGAVEHISCLHNHGYKFDHHRNKNTGRTAGEYFAAEQLIGKEDINKKDSQFLKFILPAYMDNKSGLNKEHYMFDREVVKENTEKKITLHIYKDRQSGQEVTLLKRVELKESKEARNKKTEKMGFGANLFKAALAAQAGVLGVVASSRLKATTALTGIAKEIGAPGFKQERVMAKVGAKTR